MSGDSDKPGEKEGIRLRNIILSPRTSLAALRGGRARRSGLEEAPEAKSDDIMDLPSIEANPGDGPPRVSTAITHSEKLRTQPLVNTTVTPNTPSKTNSTLLGNAGATACRMMPSR